MAVNGDMSGKDAGKARLQERRTRLAASLRENLKRRKNQQRSRAAEPLPADPEKNAPKPPSAPEG